MPATTTSTTASGANPKYVTQVEFDRFYDLHTVAIRREFGRGFEKMDQLEKNTDHSFELVYQKMDKMEGKMDQLEKNTDHRFERVYQKIDQLEKNTDHKFELVDRKFERVYEKMDKMSLEMQHMAARLRNSTLTRLHQPVQVIHVLDQSQNLDGIPIVPAHFPRNVKAFLNLRDDSKLTPTEKLRRSLIDPASSLTSLCRSYGCCAWKSWHRFQSDNSGSDSDSDKPSSDSDCPRTLEEAVESYTEMALRDLAEVLGLDIDRLDEGLRQFKEFSRIHRRGSQKQRKRSQNSLAAAQDVKRQRPSSTRQRRPSSPLPRPGDPEFLEFLLGEKSSSPGASEPSVHTKLGWAANSEQLEEYRAALKEHDARIREAKAQGEALAMRPSPEPKKL
ncbi:MAG: hypothetical protein L6R35_004688 [Caloplaca aegaea]|nr:MAG: hypothetical protein L6R35_004688 [Caloplaca aegaea]